MEKGIRERHNDRKASVAWGIEGLSTAVVRGMFVVAAFAVAAVIAGLGTQLERLHGGANQYRGH